ncbi:Bud site selection protein 6 [Mortierella hygrophila]|uniref:Bud site selection protein 6 n=1 Tax=Mortierella hygrophila TaxID=979708 RepID=A0A9P6F4E5_9FUNG|nr:Bud site selection protein 6 [Mortierella hygrophila]
MESIQEHPRRSLDHSSHPGAPSSPTRRRKTDQSAMNPIEATVTKLLVATKQLLESLTLWSNRKVSEEHVSDIFVQLATQFNLASQAFHEVGIDTSELAHVPDDLRNCLETALGEDPSPASLDQYLPKIKEVIINLLQGLRLKQNLYRERHEAKAARTNTPPPQLPLALPPTMPLPPATAPQTATTSGRTRTSLSNSRQPSISRPPEPVDAPSTQNGFNMSNQFPKPPTFVAPPPTFSVSAPQDEPSHAETLASLRKSDTITRRASSRRHSQRFSTLLEQNTPPVPRRQHPISDSSLSATYPGYAYSQGSSPVTSPPLPLPHNQFSPMTSPAISSLPTSPALSTPSINGYMDAMPLPPTIPMPGLPTPKEAQQMLATASTPGSTGPPAPSDADDSTMTTAHIPNGSLESVGEAAAPSDAAGVSETSETSAPAHSEQPAEPVETSLTIFLQVGKSVKKTKFEGELTHSGLRMLFMEKFQYNPGQEDFPTIYVKDPQTNIHYELESLIDVKQNAFLSLNVDDLENIQRRMDQGFASLTKELHDIRKAQEALETARHKQANAAAAAAALAAANTLERSNSSAGSEGPQALRSMVQKVMAKTATLPQTATTAVTSVQSKASVAELKAQQEEVQTLRRDLGVVRQLYSELQSETKLMLGNLAGYTTKIRKQALEAPVSSRMIIETGKVKLDKKSEDLTNKIEDLQDVVDDMKVNVTQRRGRPSENSMTFVDKECEQIDKDIAELSDYIQTIRPSWKKTWEVELQTIVKEQMFLKEQEALLEDLKEDRSSLLQTLGNLKKVTELQVKASGSGSKEFVFQPVVDEDFEGLKTVMEEVKMIEPDSNKRLKAMAQMEKLRHIELSNRIDEFEEELTTFVGSSKLRKTGGALEVERQRQQRDSENLKAMFAAKKSVEPLVPVAEDEAVLEEAPVVEAAVDVPAVEVVVPDVTEDTTTAAAAEAEDPNDLL